MLNSNNIKNLIHQKTRRLQKLKEIQAVKGSSTDPSILIEIEDLVSEIEQLQRQLENAITGIPQPPEEKQFFVGNQLKILREEMGLSTSEFIELIDLHSEKLYLQYELNEMECGESELLRVCNATNVKIDWLKHGGWQKKFDVEFLDWRQNPDKCVEQIEQLSPHAIFVTIVNAASGGSFSLLRGLQDINYEGKGEHLHLGICVSIDEYRYKIYDLMISLDFWNQPDNWATPELYKFITKLADRFFHNLYGIIITKYEDDRILYSGQIYPKVILEEYYNTGWSWVHNLVDFRTTNSKQYGAWFNKVKSEFARFKEV